MERLPRRVATMSGVLVFVIAASTTGILANSEETSWHTIWQADGYCIQGKAATLDGDSDSEGYEDGVFAAASWTKQPTDVLIPLVGNYHRDCDDFWERNTGWIGTRVFVLKALEDGTDEVALCAYPAWSYNNTPTFLWAAYYDTPASAEGPCGPGDYKAEGFFKMLYNNVWVGSGTPTTTSGSGLHPNNWHEFPVLYGCHNNSQVCPTPPA